MKNIIGFKFDKNTTREDVERYMETLKKEGNCNGICKSKTI